MTIPYLYFFNYDNNESDLCKLEARQIFDTEEKNKQLSSGIKVDPSNSAFIKKRLDVIAFSEDYDTLISDIAKEKICIEGFKVEYLVADGDTTEYPERLKKLKDVGYNIEGYPDYKKPTITYALCCFDGVWYFGNLIKNSFDWRKHKQKPYSYSNSLNMDLAKALVNIATKGNKETTLLDACCGVGTILLEACYAGNTIDGCDINPKIAVNARENIAHFNYSAKVYLSDIKDISKRYEAAIIDLPYNLFSHATDTNVAHIIESTAKITDRIVIVSTTDITDLIGNTGFRVSDYCGVTKNGKANFTRRIWLCEKHK